MQSAPFFDDDSAGDRSDDAGTSAPLFRRDARAPAGAAQVPYVPYKFDVRGSELVVHTRSRDGAHARSFEVPVERWVFVGLPSDAGDPAAIERTISLLSQELASDRVTFDMQSGMFMIQPAHALTSRVRDMAHRVVNVPLTSYSLLEYFEKRFFTMLNRETGEWVDDAPAEADEVHPCLMNAWATPFHVVVWSEVDDNTVAWVPFGFHDGPSLASGEQSPVYVWTTYESFSNARHVRAAQANLSRLAARRSQQFPEITDDDGVAEPSATVDLVTRTFASVGAMVAEMTTMMVRDVDIVVHFGATPNRGRNSPVERAIAAVRAADTGARVEIFDLRDYIERIYPDIPSHDLVSVCGEMSLVATDGEGDPLPQDAITAVALASLSATDSTAEGIPEIASTVHSSENVVFFFERIVSHAVLIARIFTNLYRVLMNMCYLSGVNLSSLTEPETAARGIVTFLDPVAAHARTRDVLPHDYMENGLHPLTHVTPLSHILVESMCDSPDPLTFRTGNLLSSVKAHGWIVRDVFNLSSIHARAPTRAPTCYGLFRGMLYTTEPIPNYEPARQWSSVIHIGNGSWIGVSKPAESAPDDSSGVVFGYFGIENACRHPFAAMRTAVEMFLSFRIFSDATASPKTIAQSVKLTAENMAIRRRVTASNLDTFRSMLTASDAASVANGQTITIKLWYQSEDKYTTNPILACPRVYTGLLENMLATTFNVLRVREPPPSPVCEPPSPVYEEAPVAPKARAPPPQSPRVTKLKAPQRMFPAFRAPTSRR